MLQKRVIHTTGIYDMLQKTCHTHYWLYMICYRNVSYTLLVIYDMLQKTCHTHYWLYMICYRNVSYTLLVIYDMLQKRVIHTTGIYDMYRVIDFYNFQCRFLKLCRVITHLLKIYNLAF